jgi:hypothetical protein
MNTYRPLTGLREVNKVLEYHSFYKISTTTIIFFSFFIFSWNGMLTTFSLYSLFVPNTSFQTSTYDAWLSKEVQSPHQCVTCNPHLKKKILAIACSACARLVKKFWRGMYSSLYQGSPKHQHSSTALISARDHEFLPWHLTERRVKEVFTLHITCWNIILHRTPMFK